MPTLSQAFCTVSYSSGFAIDSLINGCPAIATNSANFAYPLGLTSVNGISRMKLPCREQWIRDLAYCQWSQDELGTGAVWENLRPIIHERESQASGGRVAKTVGMCKERLIEEASAVQISRGFGEAESRTARYKRHAQLFGFYSFEAQRVRI